ncbi:uncharacterized protein LOC117808825 [Xyrichtys novacula]|uniref:Uncharacterized protein LOC117808825 n=1 Tax=Xyrichtys novacula TaxID=13765 RepID=A0AAV1EN19_XYRNO|nr:uncharacterized protein LOC117808825 [Xyrichtys novacula]
MIRLLILLAFLTGLEADRTEHNSDKFEVNTFAPFSYFGSPKTKVYVTLTNTESVICFDEYYQEKDKQDCIFLRSKATKPSFTKAFLSDGSTAALKNSYFSTFPDITGVTEIIFSLGTKEVSVSLIINSLRIESKDFTKLSVYLFRLKSLYSAPGLLGVASRSLSVGSCFCFLFLSIFPSIRACKDHSVCTFTGPSVVDTSGKVGTIKDLCDYRLLSSTLLADFSVEAEYKDRRRKDVSFVNTVRIKKGSATYKMEQGGVFKDKDGEVTLTSTSKTVGDLSVSKDDKGLTASYTSKGVIIIIIFDGYTVLITITGTGRIMGLKRVEGFMCQSRFSYLQACQRQFCSFNPFLCLSPLSNSCGVLTKAPFDSCHSHIAAAGYVKACENTLCAYPAVDNLLCHFLEAYASACSSFTSKSVDGWRSSSSCPATPKALCHGISCASEEFCGEKEHTGGWDCFCRPIYTAKYRKSKTLGNATQCKDNVASASLINCLLREKGIDYSTLHLIDTTCKGTLVDGLLNFEFSSAKMCGAEVTDGANEVVYKNSIKSATATGDIIRQDEVNIDFSCNHQQPAIKTVSFKIKSSSIVTPIVSGSWKYELTMKAFADAALSAPATSVQLNSRIWVELKTTGLDEKLVAMVIDSCWATKEKNPESTLKYYLISKSCANPKDATIKIEGNGVGTSNSFSFNTFQFTKSAGDVYLHCRVKLCGLKKGKTCAPDCKKSGRRRRSVRYLRDDGPPALITMAWTS